MEMDHGGTWMRDSPEFRHFWRHSLLSIQEALPNQDPSFTLVCMLAREAQSSKAWSGGRLQGCLNYICGALLLVSSLWRDYHHTPLFDMCNSRFHSQPWCDLSLLFLYTSHASRDGTMLVWPDLCAYVACYVLWFSYARVLLVMASTRWQKVRTTHRRRRHSLFPTAAPNSPYSLR
jgi:hypothetical protein